MHVNLNLKSVLCSSRRYWRASCSASSYTKVSLEVSGKVRSVPFLLSYVELLVDGLPIAVMAVMAMS